MDRTQQAVDVFDRHARVYEHKYMDVSMYGESLDAFCQLAGKPDAAVLEIACGPGNITSYLLHQRPGFRITATDLAPKMLDLARMNNPEAEIRTMDGRDVGKLPQQYNGIIAGFFLPYLSREEAAQFITDAAGRLKHNGALYISTMTDDYSRSGIQASSSGDEMYVHYHEEQSLIRVMEDAGLHIRHLQRKEYIDGYGKPTTDLMIIGVKDDM
jgi:2-polyprenyl-3-methyl-5-hydroxy-6-metoxy-1,4-benzoquinol methylase